MPCCCHTAATLMSCCTPRSHSFWSSWNAGPNASPVMPCASCGRWVEGCWVEWIPWHPDHGLELLSLRQSESQGLWYYFFCGRPACRRTSLLIRPVLTACAQDYMAYRYRTIYDKRGNIVWRLRASPVPSSRLFWHARGERDGGFNWMIAESCGGL